ncbi:unnamed protein product, partial [marine sediment metagenome]
MSLYNDPVFKAREMESEQMFVDSPPVRMAAGDLTHKWLCGKCTRHEACGHAVEGGACFQRSKQWPKLMPPCNWKYTSHERGEKEIIGITQYYDDLQDIIDDNKGCKQTRRRSWYVQVHVIQLVGLQL